MSQDKKSHFKLETDLISLRAFVAVVETGSFSTAARRINRSQSAVSLQIAKLEERLKTRLLERTSRTVSITPEGEIFISYARRILDLSDEAILAVTSPGETTVLRAGFAEYLAPQHLPLLLARFRRAHPNCDLSLVLGPGTVLQESMARGELDVVFAGPEVGGGQVLWQEPLVWTGNLNLTEDIKAPIELVLMHAPCSYRQIALDVLAKADLSWKLTIEANSVQAVQSAIQAGLGVSILPVSAVGANMPIMQGKLPDLPQTSVLSYVNTDIAHPYAQRFIDFLLTCLVETLEKPAIFV